VKGKYKASLNSEGDLVIKFEDEGAVTPDAEAHELMSILQVRTRFVAT